MEFGLMGQVIDILAAKVSTVGKTYLKDGMLHCCECHEPKQCWVSVLGAKRLMPCACQCQIKAQEELETRRKKMEKMLEISHLRTAGISDEETRRWTFENVEDTPAVVRAKQYIGQWDVAVKENIGLIFTGGVGTGKSVAAACIANALIDRQIPAMVTSLSSITRDLLSVWDKSEFMQDLKRYNLLVLDDLGVERETDYVLEQTFAIIDARYRLRKPLIVTTNLSLEELKNPDTFEKRRIYDRIMEMCVPVQVDGVSRRVLARKSKQDKAEMIFGERRQKSGMR